MSIYSRVTVIDAATLYVTESQGDFASTVLEQVVAENIPAFTHNPPTVIILESRFNDGRDSDLPVTEMTPLAARLIAALRDSLPGDGDHPAPASTENQGERASAAPSKP